MSRSNRRYGSSARSKPRKRVVIGAQDTLHTPVERAKPDQKRRKPAQGRRPRGAASSRPAASGRKGQGARFSSVKRDERNLRQQYLMLRRVAFGLLIAGLIAGVVFGVRAFFASSLFDIGSITVKGADHLTADQVRALTGVKLGDHLGDVSTRKVRKTLLSEPWIASATVEKRYPEGLAISIKERRVAALVDGGGTNLLLVSTDLHWLGEPSLESSGAIVIRDVGTIDAEPGTAVEGKELVNAIRVLNGLSDNLKSRVRMVSARSIEKTSLVTDDDVEIFIGEAVDLSEKDEIIRQILDKEKGRVVYINVRVVESPSWRGLTEE